MADPQAETNLMSDAELRAELAKFRKLANSDPYQYIAGNCCGDAHMVLETSLEQLRVIGFEIETRETEHFTEHVWHNRRAELAEARNEALLQALKEMRVALSLLLDNIDYESGACSLTEMIGAILPKEILRRARSASQEAKTPGGESA